MNVSDLNVGDLVITSLFDSPVMLVERIHGDLADLAYLTELGKFEVFTFQVGLLRPATECGRTNEARLEISFSRKLREKIDKLVDEEVDKIIAEVIKPKLDALIESEAVTSVTSAIKERLR